MPLLAIESSTECCSLALRVGDEIFSRSVVEPRAHARLILPWTEELLAEAGIGFGQLDALAVSRGPGSFTSLRIGLGIVQGIALAHDLPVHAVSSLDVLAESADPDTNCPRLLALLDARMGEVYAAWYRSDGARRERIGEEQLLRPDQLSAPDSSRWNATGPGARAFGQVISQRLGEQIGFIVDDSWPQATALLRLAGTVEAVPGYRLEPTYLRDQVTG
jgi:tRNA threonylcarbamoyladenosine biosynthesis protein TsaB